MLTLWRRHRAKCPHHDDRYFKRCRCCIWCEGTIEGNYLRRSLKTRSWSRGEELKNQLEDGKHETQQFTIEAALGAFIRDCESRNLNNSTLGKYRRLVRQLNEFYAGATPLLSLAQEAVRAFTATRKIAPRTAGKELERLRSFFRFCQDNGWLTTNPAKSIKAPQVAKLRKRCRVKETVQPQTT